MAGSRERWTRDRLTVGTFLRPKRMAKALFHPAWIPEPVDPSVERLKRVRVVAGAVAVFGVYTFVQHKFDTTEILANILTAAVVLLFITPLTVGVMLLVWRRTGTVRQLRRPLLGSLKLLLLFLGLAAAAVFLLHLATSVGGPALVPLGFLALWLLGVVGYGAVQLAGNYFGSAAVHRCLPPLLASVTTWLMAVPDLVTGDLHGLSLTLGVVFILGAPVTVTAIAVLETNRLRRRYGIRLRAHPATLPVPRPVAYPPPGPRLPPQGTPFPPGNPYAGYPHGSPSGPYPQGDPYAPRPGGNPPAPGTRQNPYGRGPYGT
ncbi:MULTISPECIES: hypothetical protein [unclassified Streptomyces]|uniref:hypothetical protein n=1 Tax=unclassified Streptomyces TaxID=2593676 RepID=UPI0033BC7D19